MNYFGINKKINTKDKYVKDIWMNLEIIKRVWLVGEEIKEFEELKGKVKRTGEGKFKIKKEIFNNLSKIKQKLILMAFKEV